MVKPSFLSVQQVLAIHRRMITEFGGDPLVRDFGLLESAVLLPAAQFQKKFLHRDIPTMAAAYLFHLCRNHPFMDGNKRTALAASEVFLLTNDYTLKATDDQLEALTMGIADGSLSKEEAIGFYHEHAELSPTP